MVTVSIVSLNHINTACRCSQFRLVTSLLICPHMLGWSILPGSDISASFKVKLQSAPPKTIYGGIKCLRGRKHGQFVVCHLRTKANIVVSVSCAIQMKYHSCEGIVWRHSFNVLQLNLHYRMKLITRYSHVFIWCICIVSKHIPLFLT